MRNKRLGKHSSNRAQISTLETILSLFWLTLRDWIFFKGLFIFLLCRQQDLNLILHWERMWTLKSYNCEHCGSDFISGRALKYHFQQKHLGKVHRENVTKKSWRGSSEVTVRYSERKWGAGSQKLLFLKHLCFVFVGSVFFILSWRFINRKLKGKTRGHRPQVRCSG